MAQTLKRRNWILLSFTSIAIILVSIYLFPALARTNSVTANTWTRTGPVVGRVNSLAIAPSNPSRLFAGINADSGGFGGTSTTGVYKTTDGGLNWTRSGLIGKTVFSLAIDPTSFDTVYAGTDRDGLFKSTDGGSTWNGPYIGNTFQVLALAIDPGNTAILYASVGGNGLKKSTDGGLTWSIISTGIQYYTLSGLAIDPANTNTVYASGGYGSFGQVYKSTNAGANWATSNTGLPQNTADLATAIAIDKNNPAVLYLASQKTVYKSVNGGANWTQSGTGLPTAAFTSVAIDPTNSAIVFAATLSSGIFKSNDSGGTWNSAGLSTIGVNALIMDPVQSNTLYAGTQGSGVLRSTNGGIAWTQSSKIPYGDVRELAIDPTNPAVLYANTSDSVYKSADHAASWLTTSLTNNVALIQGVPTHKLVIDPTTPATLYIGVDFSGVFKSTNSGGNWTFVFPVNTNIGALAIDPSNPQILYLSTYPFDLRKSTDGGATWPRISSRDASAIAVDPTNSQTVYAATDFGVAKSTNGGVNWIITSLNGTSISTLALDPTNPSVIYAAASSGVAYRSGNGGTSWNPVFTNALGHALSFALDPTAAGTVFLGTDQGVYLSTNGGQSAGNFSAGLPATAMPVMALSYDSPGRILYAGTQEGVFALPLGPVVNEPVSGQVTDVHGVGISGVTLTISGAPNGQTLTTLTDAGGNYSFNNSVGGDTLTPTKTGLVFSPESFRAVSSGGPIPITGTFNFMGGASFSTLSGRVTDGTGNGIADVLISVTGSMQQFAVTDSTGAYSIRLFPGGNYTITPSKTGYVFFPTPLGFTNLPPGDRVLVTIVGTTHPYNISGQVVDGLGNPMSTVAIRLTRAGAPDTFTLQTNGSGNYTFSNLASEATYTVTPVKAGFRFTPTSTTFANPSGNQTANFTATPLPMVQFGASNYVVGSGDIKATVTVTRSGDLNVASTVDYATSDGTASQQVHYTISTGTLAFAAGETSRQFDILITDGANTSYPATVNLTITNPVGAILGTPATAVLTINQNHSWPPNTNPADDTSFFVRQQYADFLNREPDPSGFSFWIGQINQCGTDPVCLRNKRIDVSNAFFYEQEYQQTGSYVYRLYRAAFGNTQPFPNPDPNGDPVEKNKLVNYAAFVPDRARVVGGSNLTQAQVDLANAFVLRPQFLAKYPLSLDGPGFVDAVLATIRNDIGPNLTSQRAALITLFNSGGRGAVMYRLADDNVQTNPIDNRAFIDAEYNRAFVATQYFGYLRRDADMGGFLFWLGQVNGAPLRDVPKQHAMVCSFITSAEYQLRFSSVVTHTNSECQ